MTTSSGARGRAAEGDAGVLVQGRAPGHAPAQLRLPLARRLYATREISIRTEALVIRSVTALAKFRFHAVSKVRRGGGDVGNPRLHAPWLP